MTLHKMRLSVRGYDCPFFFSQQQSEEKKAVAARHRVEGIPRGTELFVRRPGCRAELRSLDCWLQRMRCARL